jgi:hypothetical protein
MRRPRGRRRLIKLLNQHNERLRRDIRSSPHYVQPPHGFLADLQAQKALGLQPGFAAREERLAQTALEIVHTHPGAALINPDSDDDFGV